MKFQVQTFEENGFYGCRLIDNGSGVHAEVLPGYGMMLHAFRVPLNGELFNIIDGYSNADVLEREIDKSYKGCKMSPFACRIPKGIYEANGQTYELQQKFMDGSAIHGLLWNKPFEIMHTGGDDERATVTGRYQYIKDDSGYPFTYVCEVKYSLFTARELEIETTITNLDEQVIPIADGWHPYFRPGGRVDECMLQFNSVIMLEFDENCIPTGKSVSMPDFIGGTQVGPRKLDNCFVLQVDDSKPSCILKNLNNGFTLSIFSSKRYPFLQIYIPDHRESIAIENLSGAPDCFNNHMGLLQLSPRHSKTFWVRYKVN